MIEKLEREDVKIASLTKRIIAFSIDDFLVSFIIFFAFYDSFANIKNYQELILLTDKLLIFILIAYTLYHWIFVWLYGKTIGKMVVKIKVVDINTLDKPDSLKALIRSVVRNFDEMFFYLGMLYAFVDKYNRAIHDIVGNCVVIEDN
jgi:uncharacterized RDD family membrane protein YckC